MKKNKTEIGAEPLATEEAITLKNDPSFSHAVSGDRDAFVFGRSVYHEIDIDKAENVEDIKSLLKMVICASSFKDIPTLKATDELLDKYEVRHLIKD